MDRQKYRHLDDYNESVPTLSLKDEEYLMGLDNGPEIPGCCWFIHFKKHYKSKPIEGKDLLFHKSLAEFKRPHKMLDRLKREGKL